MLKINEESDKTISDSSQDILERAPKMLEKQMKIINALLRDAKKLKIERFNNIKLQKDRIISALTQDMKSLREEIIKSREEINELKKTITFLFDASSQREVYFRPVDAGNKDLLIHTLFDKNISYDSFYSPKGDVYLTSMANKNILENSGIKLEIVEVKNLGALPKEKRREIKQYHRSQAGFRRKKALDRLRAKYGPV